MLNDLDLNELKWDQDGSYWYSRDSYNITPADMHEYARKLETENAKLLEALENAYRASKNAFSMGNDFFSPELTKDIKQAIAKVEE